MRHVSVDVSRVLHMKFRQCLGSRGVAGQSHRFGTGTLDMSVGHGNDLFLCGSSSSSGGGTLGGVALVLDLLDLGGGCRRRVGLQIGGLPVGRRSVLCADGREKIVDGGDEARFEELRRELERVSHQHAPNEAGGLTTSAVKSCLSCSTFVYTRGSASRRSTTSLASLVPA